MRLLLTMIRRSKWIFTLPYIKQYCHRRAQDIRTNKVTLFFSNLPQAFQDFRILHLSDLHLESSPGIEEVIAEAISKVDYDLAIMTGDYSDSSHFPLEQLRPKLAKVFSSLNQNKPALGVLGNHDSCTLVACLEEMAIQVLINETVYIEKNGDRLAITGIDDVNTFATPLATQAMLATTKPAYFRLLMAHSPEAFQLATESGYHLYLSGHTHGGQICLPGGIPVITRCRAPRQLAKGKWKINELTGYTNSGAGVSTLPFRLNCPGEIAMIKLKSAR